MFVTSGKNSVFQKNQTTMEATQCHHFEPDQSDNINQNDRRLLLSYL